MTLAPYEGRCMHCGHDWGYKHVPMTASSHSVTLEHELHKTRQALHLLTEAFELLEAERNRLREEVDRLALDLKLKEK